MVMIFLVSISLLETYPRERRNRTDYLHCNFLKVEEWVRLGKDGHDLPSLHLTSKNLSEGEKEPYRFLTLSSLTTQNLENYTC